MGTSSLYQLKCLEMFKEGFLKNISVIITAPLGRHLDDVR